MSMKRLVEHLGVTRESLRPQMWSKTRYDDIAVVVFDRLAEDDAAYSALCDSLGLPKSEAITPIISTDSILGGIAMTRGDLTAALLWFEVALKPFATSHYGGIFYSLIHGWVVDGDAFDALCDAIGLPPGEAGPMPKPAMASVVLTSRVEK
jgi:hypothetical protein